ncbi:MAG: winged helix-turn-helix domain-containing protein [Paracoccaceae bacterium]
MPETPGSGRVWHKADGTLRDETGTVVPLRRQSAQLLEFLVIAPRQVMSNSALIDAVWNKIAVSDDSLNQCVADIRKAVGDSDRTILQNHARRGYSLAPQVPEAPRGRRPGRALLAAAVAVIALAAGFLFKAQEPEKRPPTIAIMAFEDFSPAPDQDYLSDAIAEGITTEIAKFRPLTTIARNSSFSFRGKGTDVREIGEVLGVDFILEGSQEKHGETLKITVQLIEVETNTHLWAESYEGNVGELFDFQADIIRRVAATVGGKLLMYVPPSGDRNTVTAMHLHARGVFHLQSGGAEEKAKSVPLFEAAIEADPESALGYIGLGFYYRTTAGYSATPEEREQELQKAEKYAEFAADLAPNNYLTQWLIGRILAERGKLDQALAHYENATELNPSVSAIYAGGLASAKMFGGDTAGAVESVRYGMFIDPLHQDWYHWSLGLALWSNSECDEAVRAFRKMAKIPDVAQRAYAAALACAGDSEGAKAAIDFFLSIRPDATIAAERERYKDTWRDEEGFKRWLADLEAAGLPN